MQFEALQVFCDIARCRSFSQAAAMQQPPLTQSAVSQIVHQLEKRLGVQLINRSTRPLQLTPLGQAYYQGCKELVESYLELEASIKQGRTQLTTTLQVAAIYSIGLGDMGQYVERFTAEQPFARVHVEYLHSNRVVEKVHDGSVDLGLVSFPRKTRSLIMLPWREEEMVLACQPSHRLAQQMSVRPLQLAGEKYIAFDKELGIRRQVDRFLRQHDVTVEIELEFDNIENIKKGIEIAGGVALLPEPTLRQEVQAGLLVARPLAGCRFVRPLAIIYRRKNGPSPAAQRFIDLLLENGSSANRHQHNGTAHDRNTARKKK
ncbi:MAG TPA: LysR family transcriptional regulator [Gemmataceae bacterium]|nr:LysR family transcriptional regulator [Gemmataceae bacterium]